MNGGARPGAGRKPGIHGVKQSVSVRLSPDVVVFCRQHPQGRAVLEDVLRRSSEFKRWEAKR